MVPIFGREPETLVSEVHVLSALVRSFVQFLEDPSPSSAIWLEYDVPGCGSQELLVPRILVTGDKQGYAMLTLLNATDSSSSSSSSSSPRPSSS